MSLPARRLLNAAYAMWADRLALADTLDPVKEGERSRLEQFDRWLNEPFPGSAEWGDPNLDEGAAAELENALAMLGGGG